MNKYYLILFVFFFFGKALIAQPNELLAKSYEYYNSIEKCSFLIKEKLKTAISTDTTTVTYESYFQKTASNKMMKLVFDKDNNCLYNEEGSWFIYNARKAFFHNNSKENEAEERLKFYPYWMPKFLFQELPHKLFVENTTIKSNDKEGYTINTMTELGFYLIELDSLYRINRFREIIIDNKFGTQVKDFFFTEANEANSISLFDELKIAQTEYVDVTNRKKIWKEPKTVLNKTVNIDSLRIILGLSKNDQANLYFDFFYKDCYPCIQSIPKVNELYHTVANTLLRVYGIDPQKSDEGDWTNFKSRYTMDYAIIDGERARQIQRILLDGVHFGWPTNIVVSPSGKIIYVHEGYEKKLVKEVTKVVGVKP